MNNIENIIKKYNEEINKLDDKILLQILNEMTNDQIKKLKGVGYNHYGNGLYIRNNYIYNNKKIREKIEPDEFSYLVYSKLLDKNSK